MEIPEKNQLINFNQNIKKLLKYFIVHISIASELITKLQNIN